MIRVAIADDQALVRAGFVSLLDAADDISVVGEACNGTEAAELARTARPDVLLMDVRMPGVDGIEATRAIDEAARRIVVSAERRETRGQGNAASPLPGNKVVWKILDNQPERGPAIPDRPLPADVDTWDDYEAGCAALGVSPAAGAPGR